MAVTIKDVAKQANVSPSTVSRVIADNSRISPKTKQKVREVMETLGYYPNFQARNLVIQKSRTLGVIMENSAQLAFQNPFFPEVLRGISAFAHESKFGLYLSTGSTEEEIFEEVVSMTLGRQVDGIILLYSKINDRIMEYLQSNEIPFSVVGRPYKDAETINYVDNDNIGIAAEVTNYLIGLGHRRIAFVGGDPDHIVSLDRLEGYRRALAKAGIAVDSRYIAEKNLISGQEGPAIQNMMKSSVSPTAIVTHDDLVAYEVIGYLRDLGLRVPEDVSIIGFNNHTLSEHLKPPLSSVDISICELGSRAAELVLAQIEGGQEEAGRFTVPARLIERGSCQRP
ncbi:LacI family DNA-binding transcriptional regulator [Indiicoccus explosivorum]|uniref:LacI family DNA-binding transcriptional regulator n=1 Tax=Indiicoccus explosivorum TaxID=1917864 RepID=UPI000B447FAA|nr:LacI family DNA-binding transcriptional regulator [Indiicoccus explosivorum]